MRLKDLEVRHAAPREKDYKLADGGGLHLLVRPHGSKLWRMKYRFAGKEKLLSFGAYLGIGLGDARLKRAKAKIASPGLMRRMRRDCCDGSSAMAFRRSAGSTCAR